MVYLKILRLNQWYFGPLGGDARFLEEICTCKDTAQAGSLVRQICQHYGEEDDPAGGEKVRQDINGHAVVTNPV